ncbi:NAD-dependent epimerase/dehydratase family protein [Sinomicrobium soli]|uniref:NAD-dependent epimerase/dehydratase family protein n=1 Tax=Sinomicrobium sp. N-1-3-6 TaxID=2219864 RepID=UPI000DCE0EED|nr:NAD-dependent epimerase/dehydratase family protein [Sinomicrobium sp. N-1-3-6]RAV28580.1 NAD-dependent epimerase [Sinomicrobium sp. N-1-3-6]
MTPKILIIGACGQIGSELTLTLRDIYGTSRVIASDIRKSNPELAASGPFEILDATDKEQIGSCIDKHGITDVYLMAAMLSATAEKYPDKAWDLNMNSLFHVLDFARDKKIKKVFWPSSIAVFGPGTPKEQTPQQTIMEPSTVYGISKLAGERWCEYYYKNYGVDVRSIRYPGLISWKTSPGGGTTDYAIDIYHQAIEKGSYECFLDENTTLPMMYMDDAIRATISLMQAESNSIKIRSSYNLSGVSFNPGELAKTIQKHIPGFSISYKPDFRQKIADSWPGSIDDSPARTQWGWKAGFDLEAITEEMLSNLNFSS